MRLRRVVVLLGLLLLCGCLGRLSSADRTLLRIEQQSAGLWLRSPPPDPSLLRVPLPDPRVAGIGRITALWSSAGASSQGAGLRLSWPGSELQAEFLGPSLTLELRTQGEVHFDVWIDGAHSRLSPASDAQGRYGLAGLGPGPHRLRLQKRTEADAGIAEVLALELSAGATLLPAPPLPSRRLEFIGDSMTVGACVLDDGAEQWQRRESHCHRLSFAALLASRLGAQHRAIAISGLGVSRSRSPLLAHEIFDRREPKLDSPQEPADGYQPDAVVILLGHNDVLAADLTGREFPREFVADYVRLVRAVRHRYPQSLIVCLTGGMHGSRASSPLRRAFAEALATLQATDPRVIGHRLAAWSFLHPRVHTQAAIAREVEPILRRQLGWWEARSSADAESQE